MVRRVPQLSQSGVPPLPYHELEAPTDGSNVGSRSESSRQDAQVDLPPSYRDVVDRSHRALPQEKPRQRDDRDVTPEDDDSSSELGSIMTDDVEDDEDDWELDEAASQAANSVGLPSYEESEEMKANETVDDLVRNVLARPTQNAPGHSSKRPVPRKALPCPVIIPQRRPRNDVHGFVRAYSPHLQQCGIDQETFLRFLKNLHKSSQACPVFPAIELAASVAGMSNAAVAMAVTMAVSVAAGMGPKKSTGYHENGYLDRMNETLFQPAGLYAMIVKYKSDAEIRTSAAGSPKSLVDLIKSDSVNFSTSAEAMPKFNRPEDAKIRGDVSDTKQNQNLESGRESGRGSASCPAAATLIFPDIDRMLAEGIPHIVDNSIRDVQRVLSLYLDRTSQIDYEQRPSLSYRHSNPDHPLHQDIPSLVSWATGGAYNPRQRIRDRQVERHLERAARRFERGRGIKYRRKYERRYGEAYYDELQARTAGRSANESSHDSPSRAGPSIYLADRRTRQPKTGPASGLVGGLVAGLLGVAANAVSEATGYGPLQGSGGQTPGQRREFDQGHRDDSRARDHRQDSRERNGELTDDQHEGLGPGMVKRVMREDIFYMMIVNMPTDMEMSQAWDELEAAGQR